MFFFDEEKPKKNDNRPPIGTTLYTVEEHLYYAAERHGPFLEYIVFAGEVKEHLDGPKKLMCLRGRSPDGYINLTYRSLRDIGEKVFFTAREAALLAKAMTEDYERRWAWTERWGDVPLRRPWENLLKEGA